MCSFIDAHNVFQKYFLMCSSPHPYSFCDMTIIVRPSCSVVMMPMLSSDMVTKKWQFPTFNEI